MDFATQIQRIENYPIRNIDAFRVLNRIRHEETQQKIEEIISDMMESQKAKSKTADEPSKPTEPQQPVEPPPAQNRLDNYGTLDHESTLSRRLGKENQQLREHVSTLSRETAQLEKQLNSLEAERSAWDTEMAVLRKNYEMMRDRYDAEVKKNEEMSALLLQSTTEKVGDAYTCLRKD
jgi:hypothetical protein